MSNQTAVRRRSASTTFLAVSALFCAAALTAACTGEGTFNSVGPDTDDSDTSNADATDDATDDTDEDATDDDASDVADDDTQPDTATDTVEADTAVDTGNDAVSDTADVAVDTGMTFAASRTGNFIRNDCMDGCGGSRVPYTSTQESGISEADAIALAHSDLLANGQLNANTLGTCACDAVACRACGDFTNHGPASPHLYSDFATGQLVGEVVATCTPTYSVDGASLAATPMVRVGNIPLTTEGAVPEGPGVWRYWHANDGTQRNTAIQTSGLCDFYPDVRTQGVTDNRQTEWGTLPDVAPVIPANLDVRLFASSELENTVVGGRTFIWGMYALPPTLGLQYRVDGGLWGQFTGVEWPDFTTTAAFSVSQTPSFEPLKDFFFDISMDGGATADRYTVFRTHTGGHYSTTSTLTRQDGRVWVTSQLANAEMPQQLIDDATGQIFDSVAPYHMQYDLGVLPDGDYTFSLWSNEDVLIATDVLVRVRATP